MPAFPPTKRLAGLKRYVRSCEVNCSESEPKIPVIALEVRGLGRFHASGNQGAERNQLIAVDDYGLVDDRIERAVGVRIPGEDWPLQSNREQGACRQTLRITKRKGRLWLWGHFPVWLTTRPGHRLSHCRREKERDADPLD